MLPSNTHAPRRVLIVPDKFKGTLTARQAAEAIARGWRRIFAKDALELLPMSDGGDGFSDVLSELLQTRSQRSLTVDAARRPRAADWSWDPISKTAIVESAQSIGLAILPTGEHHPFHLDTLGLGETIRDALELGARRLVIGLGGSATNDGGFGMARGLGFRFLDASGLEICEWPDLCRLDRWVSPVDGIRECDVIGACDVTNPLLGPEGCSRIYGPQKGLKPEDFPKAEAALDRLAKVTHRQTGFRHDEEPGAGAAGGLGFAVRVFLGGRLESGFEIFSKLSNLPARIAASDVIVTGEGGMDRQTLMGKGTGRIAALARAAGKPCYGFAGRLDVSAELGAGEPLFHTVQAIVPSLATPEVAMAAAESWLEELVYRSLGPMRV